MCRFSVAPMLESNHTREKNRFNHMIYKYFYSLFTYCHATLMK